MNILITLIVVVAVFSAVWYLGRVWIVGAEINDVDTE